ncbi:YaaW family protein [Mangrovitalea sediminis]|uniref:YaaW family protein n=1 Tax=Mangrovitalea sediminis TaxID=1982043 RepID=UPI000BE61B25|nr:YaaW family protein [Mangrovitalea sediminis]
MISTEDLLSTSSNEELEPLVQYIIERGGWTERLSGKTRYKEHSPSHREYSDLILQEIIEFGGNSLISGYRLPSYEEVAKDVAKKLKVKKPHKYDLIALEEQIIIAVIRIIEKKLSAKQKSDLDEELKKFGSSFADVYLLLHDGALNGAVRAAGLYAAGRVITETLVQQFLVQAGRAFIVPPVVALAGPIGLGVAGAWAGINLAGPAYRVTIPCVIYIAVLRQKHMHSEIVDRHNKQKGDFFDG